MTSSLENLLAELPTMWCSRSALNAPIIDPIDLTLQRSSGGSLQSNGSLPRDSTSSPLAGSPLPDGWSEHKTSDGRCYYHNSLTGESSWTRPLEASTSPTSTSNTSPLEVTHL